MSLPTTGILLRGSTPAAPPGLQNAVPQTDNGYPAQDVTFYMPLAVPGAGGLAGSVKPDGSTITQDADGTIHAVGGSGSGGGSGQTGASFAPVVPDGAKDGSNTQYTLPAPPLPNTGYFYIRNGVMQRQLGANAEYSVQGTTLTVKYPLVGGATPDWHEFYYTPGSPNSQTGGGGGVVVTPAGAPVVRGSSSAYNDNASTITCSLPAGSQAGDFALLFLSTSAVPPTAFGAWTQVLYLDPGADNLVIFSKVLDSSDISAGNVTLGQYNPPPPTYPGYGPIAAAMVTFMGATGGVRETESSTTGYAQTLTTTNAVISTDIAVYFAGGHGGSGTTPTPTITPASGSANVLQTAGAGFAQPCVLADQAMPGGAFGVTYNIGGGATGLTSAQVIVKGS